MAQAAVLVEQSQPYGILITNGEFTSFVDKKWCTKCKIKKKHQIF